MAFAEYLAGLDTAGLTALLLQRPDALVQPAPRGYRELAQRLDVVESLRLPVQRCTADEVTVLRAVAFGTEKIDALGVRLGATAEQVRAIVDGLADRGLAWRDGERVELPRRLAGELSGEVHAFDPVAVYARRVGDGPLYAAVTGLGGYPTRSGRSELIAQLAELYLDGTTVARAVAGLSPAASECLERMRDKSILQMAYRPPTRPEAALLARGLILPGGYGNVALPREVVVALRHLGEGSITGRPELPAADGPVDDGRAGAEAALRALAALLDEARHRPLATSWEGGMASGERTRLAERLGPSDPTPWIDVAIAAGLLERTAAGYAASGASDAWRDDFPARRWATVTLAWWARDTVPTNRRTDDGKGPSPQPLNAAGGAVRRALLRAAAVGRSLDAVAPAIGWFCPLHPYDVDGLDTATASARHEAGLLGVITGDRLTELGEHLVTYADGPDALDALACAGVALLPPVGGPLRQYDLNAAVSGQAGETATRPLAAATSGPHPRPRVDAAVLAERLRAGTTAAEPVSASYRKLADVASQLDEAAVALLADALDHEGDVVIVYWGTGNCSVRPIRPQQLSGSRLLAWCHLRAARREFELSSIVSVTPLG